MSLVPSLLQAIVQVDGEALVMHAGDKPYVVAPAGQIELASSALALDAVSGIVAQLLPSDVQHTLEEFGAVQYDLPPQPGFPRERFTVVVARGGDDVWAEIRRRRVLDENILDDALAAAAPTFQPGSESPPAQTPEPDTRAVSVTQEKTEPAVDAQAALTAQAHDAKLTELGASLGQVVEQTTDLTARLDELTRHLAALDERTKGIEEIDRGIRALIEAARQAEARAPTATEQDDVLKEHREAIRDLTSHALQTQETLDALRKERAEFRDFSQAAEERLSSLTALAEQVSRRAQDLDAQQQAVEHAVAQATHVTDMIVALKAQVGSLESLGDRLAQINELANKAALAARIPELEAKMDAVLGGMARVEEATRTAVRLSERSVAPLARTPPVPAVGTAAAPAPHVTTEPAPQVMTEPASAVDTKPALGMQAVPVPRVPVDDSLALDAQILSEESHRGRPAADDDLTLPEASQLWPGQRAGGGRVDTSRLASGEGLEIELPENGGARVDTGATIRLTPARLVPPVIAGAVSAPPAESFRPAAPPVAPTPVAAAVPPTAAVEPATARPAPQPAVVLPMSRNPIRAERAEAPPPPADHALPDLERLLRTAASRGASTLYVSSDARPSIRVDGEVQVLDQEPVLTPHDVVSLLLTLMPERSHEALRTGATTEWICDIEAVGRVRCMSVRDHGGPGGVFRLMPGRAVSVDQLGLPPAIQALATEPEGLVLIAGPRSSGKRTLISALVDLINRTRHDHVITIEREINVVHARGSAIVSQREVRGGDEEVLAAARAALREDPDVLVLERIRTGALMNVALEAAASGHLVIGGFAAHDATETIDRIIDLYAPEHSRQVQFALADHLRAVVAQILLARTGGGRVAARELLLNTPAVASVLAEGTTSHLPMAIEGGRRHGMVPLHDALVPLVQSGAVDVREACRYVIDRSVFLTLLKRHGVDTSMAERLA